MNITIQQALDDGSGSGYVEPSKNCPHVTDAFRSPSDGKINTKSPCTACQDTTENWICLTCYEVGCSRFQNGHAVKHYETTKHPLVLSFSDLSIWCYECETYIKNPVFSPVFKLAHNDKFGSTPGSYSGSSTEEEIKEYLDDPSVVEAKVKEVAEMIRNSKHFVIYTGAGVSTAAKIPDYRGPTGVWTLRDKGLSPSFEISLEDAQPTFTHMAIQELVKRGLCKAVVSTNVDGLHMRSGIPRNQLAELHGNIYVEYCSKCKDKQYIRKFDVTKHRADHKTGRKCDVCSDPLLDTIINFGENLPSAEIEKTSFHTELSDMSLVLGTSMKVSPANQFPYHAVLNGGKMVIVNLQKTPYDKKATAKIHEKVDPFMNKLMTELDIAVPMYNPDNDGLHHNLTANPDTNPNNNNNESANGCKVI